MSDPKASVIIATYNRALKLTEAIKQMEKSDYPRSLFEIIIVDDCSTDRTARTIKGLRENYSNIRHLKTKKNSGPAVARNIGIRASKGNVVYFTDDDCMVPRDLLRRFSGFLEENPSVGGVGGGLLPGSKSIFAKIEMLKDKILGISDRSMRIGKDIPVGFTSNMMYRKEVFKKAGYFNEKFKVPAGEDPELKERVCRHYDLASMPVYVIHNHDYDLEYMLNLLFKQGLDEFPPKGRLRKISLLIMKSPYLIFNILKKIMHYRKTYK